MSNSQIPSPARSQGPSVTPRRYKSRSVGSPARVGASFRLSSIVDQFKENNKDSFAASPLSKTLLSDNTDIEMPRRKSWWRKVENSRDMVEVLESEQPVDEANDVFKEFGVEVLTQDRDNYTLDLPESSGSESIQSIIVPQRKLFIQKENLPQKKFGAIASTSEASKPNFEDQTIHVGKKSLFGKTSERTKPIFPSALLNVSNDNTIANKTKEQPVEIKAQARGLFGNRPGAKRKNMFADFVVSESEEEIPDVQPKRFTFNKPSDPMRRSSNASSVTTDIEMDDWKLLPSSTMVDHQLEEQLITPGKRARLSKLSEAKESTNTNSTEQSNKSMSSKNKTKISPAKPENTKSKNILNSSTKDKAQDDIATEKNSLRNKTTLNKSRDLTKKVQDISKNETKTLNNSKNLTQTHNIPDIANEELKEISNIKNKTYNINKTLTKEASSSEIVEVDKDKTIDAKDSSQNKTTLNKSKDLTKVQNISNNNTTQNETKTLNKSKILTQTQNISDIANEKLKETSNVENKTYSINKTKEASRSKIVEVDKYKTFDAKDNVAIEQTDKQFETELDTQEDEEMALTYEEDVEIINHASDSDKKVINDKAKTICVDNRLSKVSEYMENLEKEMSSYSRLEYEAEGQKNKYDGKHILQMETPMPNKSVRLTNKFVEETPDSKSEERKSLNNNTSDKDITDKVKDQHQKEALLEKGLNKNTENVEEQIVTEIIDHIILQNTQMKAHEREAALNRDKNNEADKDTQRNYNKEEEISEDQIEASDQDQAEAEIEASDQDGTEIEQELEADDEENEQQNQIEADNEEENLNLIEEDVSDEEIDAHELEVSENLEESKEIEDEQIEQTDNEEEEILEAEEEEIQDDEEEIYDDEEEIHDDEEKIQEEEDIQEEEEEVQNKSQEIEEENKSLDGKNQNQGENESQEDLEEDEENDEIEQNDDIDQNESQEEVEALIQNKNEEEEEAQDEPQNVTHNTTGGNRNKSILRDKKNEIYSFTEKGRNKSIRKTESILKNDTTRQSMAPARESTGISDGTNNSSAEGSGWDSHRTTRKTLRQTFGKDFTPRKSLRTLVMEKAVKRQTMINEANAAMKLHQANSTELPEHDDAMDYEEAVESDHEASRQLRQTKLEMYVQKMKQDNMEMKQKIEDEVRNLLKPNSRTDILWAMKPNTKLTIRRAAKSNLQNAPKVKRLKSSAIALENIPPELLEDMKYKPPKRFKPANASWITKRLYKFLEEKLEPKYDYKARVRAEKLVETIYIFVRDTKRARVAPVPAVAALKRELARLDVTTTHFEFYNFFREFMPLEVVIKVVPDIINDIPVPREGVFAPIIVE